MPGYDFTDTIAAPATPLSASAIGIVRLSGLHAWEIARQVLRGLPAEIEPRRAYVCALPLPDGDVQDTAVALFWQAPLSYTGEFMAELMLHGNPLLLRHALRLCVEHGARPAEAGEFTYRAYLQCKLDLSQAEAVHELIQAGSTRALTLAASQLAGLPGRRIHDWQRRLQELLAGVEVIHDYAADDLDASLDPEQLLTPDKLRDALAALVSEMATALEATSRSASQRSGLTVAICGPPNVGKSTLFNALLGHERALTAPEPGTTRDYLAESLEDAGVRLTLVDTAGYRQSADRVEAAGVELAADWARSADRVLWVTAADAPSPAPLPDELAERKVVSVVTRCDLLPEWPTETESEGESGPPIYVSGISGRGLDVLRTALRSFIGDLGEPALESFGARQSAGVEQAHFALGSAIAALGSGMAMDAAALDMYSALEHLHGTFEQHDRSRVIEQIFSGFCVGK